MGFWVEMVSQNGIIYFLEYMVFKGMKICLVCVIVEEIEVVGGEFNVVISIEYINYYVCILVEDLLLVVDILLDILQNFMFEVDELVCEQYVILQEIGVVNDMLEDWVFDLFQVIVWLDQVIGWLIFGMLEIVSSFDCDSLNVYFLVCYWVLDMVLLVVGVVDYDEFVVLVQDKFGGFEFEMMQVDEEVWYFGGEIFIQKDLMEVQVLIGFEGCFYKVDDYYVIQILVLVFGGGMLFWLFQQICEKYGLCYVIYSFYWVFFDMGLFGIYVVISYDDFGVFMFMIVDEFLVVLQDIIEEEVV